MIDAAARLTGALAGRYTIERELGAGGMATVYLAHDVRHDRKVALKVLRPELSAILGGERFLAEIKTTANLQHPHILSLFDSGEADGLVFYVMPFVEGESLRDRLTREKQLPVEEAVAIAREVADALSYAHAHGVVHRDIKPENIMLAGGHALVADFGIALAASRSDGSTRMTETGMSLGTPHYMSPEQSMGEREITPKADIYALGCVTYEMLTGEPPFTGPTAQAIIARVMTEEPRSLTLQRKTIPPHVEAAVMRALQKLPADRFASASAFAEALGNPAFTSRRALVAIRGSTERTNRLSVATAAIAIVAVVAAFVGWLRPRPAAPTARFAVVLTAGASLHSSLGLGTVLAASRDGRLLAFVGVDSAGVSRLWLKREGDLEPRPIPGTEGAFAPFFSPDGRQIGFFRNLPARMMDVVAVDGGSPHIVLFAGDSAGTTLGVSGAVWAADGFIYYDADRSGIRRMRPDGSARGTVLALDETKGDIGFAWPDVTPGGGVLVARLRRGTDQPDRFTIVASRIGSGAYTEVADGVIARFYGHQLFIVAADGTLRVSPFDTRRLRLPGESRIVATGVRVAGDYAGVDLTVDDRGTIHYVAGLADVGRTLAWVDLAGRRAPADPTWVAPWPVGSMESAPDARQVLLGVGIDTTAGIWIKQLPSGATLPLPQDSGRVTGVGWSADGASLVVAYRRNGATILVRQRADGLGRPVTVARDSLWIVGIQESRDGRWIVASRTASPPRGPTDLVMLAEGRDTVLRPMASTSADAWDPRLSPNGRWLAYVSNKSGRAEVYVQPFPDVDRGIWQVSIDGGVMPRWAPAGGRLYFYRAAVGLFAVDASAPPAFGRPQPILTQAQLSGTFFGSGWGISPDGTRLLTLATVSGEGSGRLVRVENAMTELNARSGR